ncbi:MAG: TIGR00730 family Rossman fold protein [Bacteriovoracia bacterium]
MTLKNKTKRICVFCGSRSGNKSIYLEDAKLLGRKLAERGIPLVYGGANTGIMGAVANEVLKSNGEVIGVYPDCLSSHEKAHSGLSELIHVKTMHERKQKMFDLSDAFLVLPGGFGTLDEAFEMITWRQIKTSSKPVIFLNSGGFFDAVLTHIERMLRDEFLYAGPNEFFQTTQTVERALEIALANS